jgi:hypothetical protein
LPNSKLCKYHYTLTFTYNFSYSNDTVYFAHCFPYTYSDLTDYLKEYSSNPEYKSILRVDTLCKTLAGNDCYVLTITNGVDTYTS